MGRYSGSGMGAAQSILSVGNMPRVSGHKERKPRRSRKSRVRMIRVYAAQHGLFLRVGKLKNGEFLLYPIKDVVGFFKMLEEAAEENTFARLIIRRMYGHIGRQQHFMGKGRARSPLWISTEQKKLLVR